MKKLIITAFLMSAITMSNYAMADTKITVVDVQALVSNSAQVAALKAEQKSKIQELNTWLKTVKADVDKQQTKEGKEKLVKKYDAEFVKKQQAIKENYAKKLLAIDKSITASIVAEAKAKGYDLVLSKQGAVIYGGSDITADLIKTVK